MIVAGLTFPHARFVPDPFPTGVLNMQAGLFLTDPLNDTEWFVYFGLSVGLDCRMMPMLFVAPDPDDPSFVSSQPLPVIDSARRVIELEVAPHVVKTTSTKILAPGVDVSPGFEARRATRDRPAPGERFHSANSRPGS